MKWIVSEDAKKKEKKDKKKLKRYWSLLEPSDYVDDMIGNENGKCDSESEKNGK